ncbi:GTPase IMAP family member 4-like [Osmerus eperlanus]|uniref:GTPase IMAP family member 4-like n=1 Tax=Osmerus eperlanus TaxID=29151 RepID=UPI002E0FC168
MATAEEQDQVGVVLLGGRWAGKSSSGNTILGLQDPEGFSVKKQTDVCVKKERVIHGTLVSVVDTPSWNWVSAEDTSEEVKVQLRESATLTGGGSPAFLIVYPLGSPFVGRHKLAVEEHLELLGLEVWRHTMVLFSRGDWLRGRGTTMEEHLQGAGEQLRWLLDKCGNRYHVLNNMEKEDTDQVNELLRKVREMLGVRGKRKRKWSMEAPPNLTEEAGEMGESSGEKDGQEEVKD